MERILLHCALCRNRKKNPDQRTIYSSSVQYVFKGHVIHTSSIFRKTSFFFLLILQDLHVLPSLPLFAQISCELESVQDLNFRLGIQTKIQLSPYWSALDFWKIEFEKSNTTNWIFSLFPNLLASFRLACAQWTFWRFLFGNCRVKVRALF